MEIEMYVMLTEEKAVKRKGLMTIFFAIILSVPIFGGAFAYEVVDVINGGAIEGRVIFSGSPPPPNKIEVGQDQDVCGKTREIYDVEVQNGGVKNAIVKIAKIEKGKSFDFPEVVLGQEGCKFIPHVVVISPGKLNLSSSDPMPHNIHTESMLNAPVNVTLNKLKRNMSLSAKFPETIHLKCDLHGWMSGFAVVAEHPYYSVTNDEGFFQLTGVPPGKYELELWHEKLGRQKQEVTVEAGKKAAVQFTYNQ